MSVLWDFFVKEHRLQVEKIDKDTDSFAKFEKNILKRGKKYTQNYYFTMQALEEIDSYIILFPLFHEYFFLVPDDVAREIIDLYIQCKEEDIYNENDVNKYKTFTKVQLIILFHFANIYGNYNRLDRYVSLSLNTTQNFYDIVSIHQTVTSEDKDKVFFSEVDNIFNYQQRCEDYNTDTYFFKESIKLFNPSYNKDKNRIKKVKSYADREKWIIKSFRLKFGEPYKSDIVIAKEKLNLRHKDKFR